MPADDDELDTQDSASQWQFGDWPEGTATRGGGLLQTILDEVTAIREGAAADRVALAKAISASFSKVDAELADMRGQLDTVRSDLDELRSAMAGSTPGDLVAALEKQLDALREAIPTTHMAQVATEVHQLRTLLVGG